MGAVTRAIRRSISRPDKTQRGLLLIIVGFALRFVLGLILPGCLEMIGSIISLFGLILIFKGRDEFSLMHEICVTIAIFLFIMSSLFTLFIYVYYPYEETHDIESDENIISGGPPKQFLAISIVSSNVVELLLIFGISTLFTKIVMTMYAVSSGFIPCLIERSHGLVFFILMCGLIIWLLAYITTYRRIKYGFGMSDGGFWDVEHGNDELEESILATCQLCGTPVHSDLALCPRCIIAHNQMLHREEYRQFQDTQWGREQK